MPIENADYFIRLLPLPPEIPAFIRLNSDGTFSIYLNSNLDFARQLDGYEHELWHIIRDDFFNGKDITEIEHI